ncbi:MAG: DUF5615 family PIN-like protein [Ignavibacteria bacterium]|nr:DUF5615 family PIN-like protein [Ignavibacteria bacterium]
MRIILDENLDPELAPVIISDKVAFEVNTVREMGWLGVKNGKLLQSINENEFNVLVTMDKNIRHQQNLSGISTKIIILRSYNNKLTTIQAAIPKLISTLEDIYSGKLESQIIEINC